MIIEIKDLPQGQKIKTLKVDVVFEDDGIQTTVSSSKIPANVQQPQQTTTSAVSEVANKHDDFQSRAKKEIPDEMKDMEF